jgi:murein DD-endopeptidase MepM/ murein hydrolase activator NlpD
MHRNKHFFHVAIATAAVGLLGAVTAFGVAPLAEAELPPEQHITETIPLALEVPESLDSFIQTETIRRGDTLGQLVGRLGANDPGFLRFAAGDPVGRLALQMRAGRTVQAEVDALGRIQRFTYRFGGLEADAADAGEPTPLTRLEIVRDGDRFTATEDIIPLERTIEMRSVVIRTSLFAATDAVGIPEGVAVRVADIFGGDIDFDRDLRKGDRLRVVYESVREEGSLDQAQAGRLLAVELVSAGERHEAFWHERDGRGEYFTFDGRSLKKSFLRNPLEFSRISSGFSPARMHPVLRDWRAHKGVDFAAPIGTRVRATADGTVEFVGQQRGYGNVVIVNHRNQYSTLYAHLNDFAPGLTPGAKIRQGDTLGAVGMTGWTTGPHLHYEVKIDGEQVDPMGVAIPNSKPLSPGERKALMVSVQSIREQLAQLDSLRVASFQ